jgi:hypothetical protein
MCIPGYIVKAITIIVRIHQLFIQRIGDSSGNDLADFGSECLVLLVLLQIPAHVNNRSGDGNNDSGRMGIIVPTCGE